MLSAVGWYSYTGSGELTVGYSTRRGYMGSFSWEMRDVVDGNVDIKKEHR